MKCAHKVLDKMYVRRAFLYGMMEGVLMGQLLRSVMILFSFLFILTVNQWSLINRFRWVFGFGCLTEIDRDEKKNNENSFFFVCFDRNKWRYGYLGVDILQWIGGFLFLDHPYLTKRFYNYTYWFYRGVLIFFEC